MTRIALATALAAAAVAGGAGATAHSTPTIVLLTPGDGATVASSATARPTFSWRIEWPEAQDGMVVWQVAADPAFSVDAETISQFCPATNVNCWTTVTPKESFSPPRGHVWYWRAGFSNYAGTIYSPTWSFTALASLGPDRQPPRVLAFPGAARRGRRAAVVARVVDDRLFVRVLFTLQRGRQIYFRGRFSASNSRWTLPVTFRTRTRLPRALPFGHYSACLEAKDRAGNGARSCARYFVH